MPTIIHKNHVWAGAAPAHIIIRRAAPLMGLCFLYSALLSVVGCGAGQSIDALFAAADSHLADARKAGAEQYAKSELDEAEAALAEVEAAIESKDKGARVLVKKALAEARLVEALTNQLKTESETTQLEAELEAAFSEANQAGQDRQSAERELERMSSQ